MACEGYVNHPPPLNSCIRVRVLAMRTRSRTDRPDAFSLVDMRGRRVRQFLRIIRQAWRLTPDARAALGLATDH